jgi:hypothetical protein
MQHPRAQQQSCAMIFRRHQSFPRRKRSALRYFFRPRTSFLSVCLDLCSAALICRAFEFAVPSDLAFHSIGISAAPSHLPPNFAIHEACPMTS